MPHPRITHGPKIMLGKAVIAGTRIADEPILRYLAAGDNIEHILANYLHLKAGDFRAAHADAADCLSHEGIAAV